MNHNPPPSPTSLPFLEASFSLDCTREIKSIHKEGKKQNFKKIENYFVCGSRKNTDVMRCHKAVILINFVKYFTLIQGEKKKLRENLPTTHKKKNNKVYCSVPQLLESKYYSIDAMDHMDSLP